MELSEWKEWEFVRWTFTSGKWWDRKKFEKHYEGDTLSAYGADELFDGAQTVPDRLWYNAVLIFLVARE